MQTLTTMFSDMNRAELLACAQEFLAWESKLLDERRFEEWYDLLDDEISYRVPIKIARQVISEETPAFGYRIQDRKSHIRVRIDRLSTGHAWSETPVSRTLRMVGSVYAERTERSDVIAVESALMVFRQRGHDELGDVIPVRRQDLVKQTSNGLLLLERTAHIAEVTLSTPNLGIFL